MIAAADRVPPRLRDVLRERPVWLLTLLVLGYFYVPLTTGTLYFRDLYRVLYPKRVFFAAAIRSGEFPLWDPMTHGGVPFLAYPSNYALYPSNIVFAFLPTLFAFNLTLVLQVLLCAVAAYWLARVLGTSRTAAFVAGLGLAFCGYTLSSTNLLPVLLGLPWIPVTLGLAIRAVRQGRSLIPAAVAAAMPLYGGAAEVAAMLYATLAVWLLTERTIGARQRVTAAACIIFGGVGLSLPATLPATSVIAQSSRAHAQPYSDFAAWSIAPERLPELVVPRFLGDTDTLIEERRWGRNLESNGYPLVISIYCGVPLLLLAIGGARRNVALAALAVVALIASFGEHLPGFRLIHEYVPFVSTFRYPVKAQVAALVPLVVFAAAGLDLLRGSERARKRTLVAAAVVGSAALLISALLARVPSVAAALAAAFSFTPLDDAMRNMLALSFVHTGVASVCFAAAVASRRQAAIACVVAADLLIAGLSAVDFAPREIFDPSPLATAAHQVAAGGRFHAAGQPMTINAPDDDLMWLTRWQIETLNGQHVTLFGMPAVYHEDYDRLGPRRMTLMSERISRVPWSARKLLFDRANVRAFVTLEELDSPEVARLATPSGALRLYSNPGGVPARFVSSAVFAKDERDAARQLLMERDLSRVVLDETDARVGDCGGAPVRVLARRVNSQRYAVDAPCDGYVVLAQNHYDGWSARIDGKPARLVRADFAFTAVAVPAGRHEVELRYFPPRFGAGLAGVLATAAVLLFVDRRRNAATLPS